MKPILSFLLLGLSTSSEPLLAGGQTCTLEHFHESATAKAGALICGKFQFDPNGPPSKTQFFEKCQNVALRITSQTGAGGRELSLEMTDPHAGKSPLERNTGSTTLTLKDLPAEFRLVRSILFKEGEDALSDEYILNCR